MYIELTSFLNFVYWFFVGFNMIIPMFYIFNDVIKEKREFEVGLFIVLFISPFLSFLFTSFVFYLVFFQVKK